MPSTRYNYLSKKKQLAELEQFRSFVEQALENFIKSSPELIEANRSIENLHELLSGKKLTRKQCIFTLHELFKKLSDDTNAAISSGEAEHAEILLDYFQAVEQLLIATNQLMNRLEPARQPSLFNKSRMDDLIAPKFKLCKKQCHYFERAIDINIYAVIMPKRYFDTIFSHSESFRYEGRATATSKVMGGILLFTPAHVITSMAYMLSPFGGDRGYKIAEAIDHYTSDKCVKALWDGVTYYGYGCNSIILPEWIEGFHKPDRLVPFQPNPSFHDIEEPYEVIFVLDARDPQTVFEEGITYTGMGTEFNPHGKVIFFKELDKARQCAELRHDGTFYDSVGGWRLYNKWEEEDLAKIYQKFKEAITSSTPLPEFLAELVIEYNIGHRSTGP